jgi:hypothetical protein
VVGTVDEAPLVYTSDRTWLVAPVAAGLVPVADPAAVQRAWLHAVREPHPASEFAPRAGVKVRTWQDWEYGRYRPPFEVVRRLALGI